MAQFSKYHRCTLTCNLLSQYTRVLVSKVSNVICLRCVSKYITRLGADTKFNTPAQYLCGKVQWCSLVIFNKPVLTSCLICFQFCWCSSYCIHIHVHRLAHSGTTLGYGFVLMFESCFHFTLVFGLTIYLLLVT